MNNTLKSGKLTNLDISNNYLDKEFYFMRSDFLGEFVRWVVRQSPYDVPEIMPALTAFGEYIGKIIEEDDVKKFTYSELQEIVSEKVFESIPEIEKLNHSKIESRMSFAASSRFHKTKPDYDYIDLSALSRNITFGLMREAITEEL